MPVGPAVAGQICAERDGPFCRPFLLAVWHPVFVPCLTPDKRPGGRDLHALASLRSALGACWGARVWQAARTGRDRNPERGSLLGLPGLRLAGQGKGSVPASAVPRALSPMN